MPSVSKKQQRLMGQALAYKRGEIKYKDLNPQYADEIKKLAKSMTDKQLKDFASTKHKNLPEKVKESNVMTFDSFNEAHKQINHKDQKLSKDMKKQSHVSSKKPSNNKLSSEDHLAEKPKKGQYREPSNKKLSSEEFLVKDQKLTQIKEFKRFLNESSNEQEEVLKWWNSLDITLQTHLANEYSANFDIIETIPYDEILNIYRNEMNLTESESNDISLNSNGNLFIVSSYSGSGIPEHFNMIGDEKTTLKEYLEIVSSMKGSNYDETFVVVLAEIIRYPISFYYTRGIEIRNAKPLRVSYDIDNHNVRHYNVPENLKNDFLEKD